MDGENGVVILVYVDGTASTLDTGFDRLGDCESKMMRDRQMDKDGDERFAMWP